MDTRSSSSWKAWQPEWAGQLGKVPWESKAGDLLSCVVLGKSCPFADLSSLC